MRYENSVSKFSGISFDIKNAIFILKVGIINALPLNICFNAYLTAYSALIGFDEDVVFATLLNSVETDPGQNAETVTPVPFASLWAD